MTVGETSMVVQIGARQVKLTHLNKVYWPADGYTKKDLLEYYLAIAPCLLPHLADRPLSLVRYPDGTGKPGFYQKDAPQGMPPWVRLAPQRSKERGSYINFVLCDNVETLVWLVNSGVVEINPWLSRWRTPDNPDFAVFDIDPSAGTSWDDVRIVAHMVKSLLDEWKLVGFPKVSGATGLHVYVPIEPKYTYRQVSSFVKAGATYLERSYPEKVTLLRKVSERFGHVYIDYPQNAKGQTISSVYGVRAGPGAPVSMPISWDEIDLVNSRSWTIKTALARAQEKGDLFREVLATKQNIDPFLSDPV